MPVAIAATSGPGTGNRPTGRARRAQIVQVASRLFYERGYHAVGMRAIAEATDIRAASLYHHFRSKEELLLAAILVVDRDFIVDHLPLLDGPGTHAERLAALVRAHVLDIGEHRDVWWLAGRELRALSAEHLEQVQVYRRGYQRRIAEFVAEGVAAGEFVCTDARLAALAILDMVNGLNEWYAPGGRYSIGELAERYAAMVLALLSAPGSDR